MKPTDGQASSQDEVPQASNEPPRGRWQFGIASLLLTMGLVSVLAAALAGLLRPRAQTPPRSFFVVMVVAAPMAVMIALSFYCGLRQWWGRTRR